MSRILRQALLLTGLLFVQSVATAQVGRDVAEEMVRKSGLWDSLGSVSTQVRAGFDEAAAAAGSPLAAADMDQIGRAADAAFAPARLRAHVVASMARTLASGQIAGLRNWFDSPRGRAITAAEAAISNDSRRPEDLVREGTGVFSAASARRQSIFQRISEATRAPEALANLAINTAVAIQQGVVRAQGQQGAPSPAELRAAFAGQKAEMMQAFAGIVLATSALAYAGIGDDDLDAYATFLETKAGSRFTGQCLLAFDQALTQASREFGQGLPSTRPKATT